MLDIDIGNDIWSGLLLRGVVGGKRYSLVINLAERVLDGSLDGFWGLISLPIGLFDPEWVKEKGGI